MMLSFKKGASLYKLELNGNRVSLFDYIESTHSHCMRISSCKSNRLKLVLGAQHTKSRFFVQLS
jgi:hypothetical protein